MASRYPSADFNANSKAKFVLQWRGKAGYKRFELGTGAVVFCALPLTLLLVWYLVASFYFVFRDDMLAKLLSNQAETQYAYEDRIASLRAHLDRVATKQLVSQDSFEDRVNELIARQSQLETRQAIVSALISDAQKQGGRVVTPAQTNTMPTGSLPIIKRGFTPVVQTQAIHPSGGPYVPMPVLKTDVSGLRLNDADDGKKNAPPRMTTQWANNIEQSLNRIEQNQVSSISSLQRSTLSKITQMRLALNEIGLSVQRFSLSKINQDAKINEDANMGGPLEPFNSTNSDGFDRAVTKLIGSLKEAKRASSVMQTIPLARPLAGEQIITSSFGGRSDPFLHSAAMHTGIDFKAGYGVPAHATSGGKVVSAGQQGGYGNMVEVDHGFGLTTRYAHLASIAVDVGDSVMKGETVGLVGSTGRSTGPHLHYETRIDGEATDPQRFLQAADRLGVR